MRSLLGVALILVAACVGSACSSSTPEARAPAPQAVATHPRFGHRDPEEYGVVSRIHYSTTVDQMIIDHYFFCLEDRWGAFREETWTQKTPSFGGLTLNASKRLASMDSMNAFRHFRGIPPARMPGERSIDAETAHRRARGRRPAHHRHRRRGPRDVDPDVQGWPCRATAGDERRGWRGHAGRAAGRRGVSRTV